MSEPSKTSGTSTWAQGKVEEAVGNVVGSKDWQNSGQKNIAEGDAEYKAAQAKGYAEGTKDRIGGKKDELVGKVTGNDSKEGQKKVAEGDSEYKAAQAKGYAEGTKDRAHGKLQEFGGKLTGDDSKEAEDKARNAGGNLKQDVNK